MNSLISATGRVTATIATLPILADVVGIQMSAADVFVLLGSILSYFLMTGIHELRAIRREAQAIQRHDLAMKALQDNRALTLGAITNRLAIETAVTDLKSRHENLDNRLVALEQRHPSSPSADH